MNGAEQVSRGQAVAALARRQVDVETVVEALAGEIVKDREAAATLRTVERTEQRIYTQGFVADVADAQRIYVDAQDSALAGEWRAFRDRTFWGRLRWLVRGS